MSSRRYLCFYHGPQCGSRPARSKPRFRINKGAAAAEQAVFIDRTLLNIDLVPL